LQGTGDRGQGTGNGGIVAQFSIAYKPTKYKRKAGKKQEKENGRYSTPPRRGMNPNHYK
jgi:hypothetical protein